MSRKKFNISTILGFAMLLVSQLAFAATEYVTPVDQNGWASAGDGSAVITNSPTRGQTGSLELSVGGSSELINARRIPLITLDEVSSIGYQFYRPATLSEAVSLKLEYWSTTEYGTLVYEPYNQTGNPFPTTSVWYSVSGTSNSSLWWSTAQGQGTLKTLSQWKAELGNPLVNFLQLGLGSGIAGATSYADLVYLNGTTWDFTTDGKPAVLPPVTPVDGTALVRVIKIFSDGNDETEVTMNLNCVTGDGSPFSAPLNPVQGAAGILSSDQHIFVIDKIPTGTDNECTVTESNVKGYNAAALCGGDGEPNEDCAAGASEKDRLSYCQFDNVAAGDVSECIITNTPKAVNVDVTKEWDVNGFGGKNYNRDATVYVRCNAEIKNADWTSGTCNVGGCTSQISFDLDDSDGDYNDEDGEDVGMATVRAKVIPQFYPTAAKPKDQVYTECEAWEGDTDSAVEVDETDCVEMEVAVGMGDSCTIVNTLFFEGIPTLNQYGLAIMALLMLSVGFVGFRRFV